MIHEFFPRMEAEEAYQKRLSLWPEKWLSTPEGLKFLENYLAPETETVNDSKGIFIEHCLAKASLRAISDGFKFDLLSVYPQFEGICGTNNREYKTNVYKKFRLKMVGNLKSFFFRNEKY